MSVYLNTHWSLLDGQPVSIYFFYYEQEIVIEKKNEQDIARTDIW